MLISYLLSFLFLIFFSIFFVLFAFTIHDRLLRRRLVAYNIIIGLHLRLKEALQHCRYSHPPVENARTVTSAVSGGYITSRYSRSELLQIQRRWMILHRLTVDSPLTTMTNDVSRSEE